LPDALRVLFLSEGVLGTSMMGHATYDGSVVPVLERTPDVEARFVGMPELTRTQRRLLRPLPVLGQRDLDFNTYRYHLVYGRLAGDVLREQLADWRPDVVHVRSHSIAVGLRREMGEVPVVPVVDATVWDWRAMGIWRPVMRHSHLMVRPSERLERKSLEAAPLVLAMTSWAEAAVKALAPRARVVEHHPGIDLERFRPAEREPREALRVLFVGARFESKGGYDLLDVLDDRLGHDVEIDLVTGDEVPARPGMRVHRLSASDPQLVELYQQADVFCLPTYGDSNPWVLLEAMACGTPAISTGMAGIPELLDGGAAGVLIRPGDRDALRRSLTGLLGDESRRRELGQRGLDHVRERYDAAQQVPRLFDLLREVSAR
jgi:glycosyltransferase involved in cell wall biosynthesis